MLEAHGGGSPFRNELARLAIEDSIPPTRRSSFIVSCSRRSSRAWLRHLPSTSSGRRIHAEAAGNTEAVLKYATAAGDYASEVGASREAAAQYARALGFSDHLGSKVKADLLERRAYACYLIGDLEDALEAQRRALDCYRELGDRLREGDSLRSLSRLLRYVGRSGDAMETGLEAVAVLERPSGGTRARDGVLQPLSPLHAS
jgi:tetratricopeptide (TPR) repeat protein